MWIPPTLTILVLSPCNLLSNANNTVELTPRPEFRDTWTIMFLFAVVRWLDRTLPARVPRPVTLVVPLPPLVALPKVPSRSESLPPCRLSPRIRVPALSTSPANLLLSTALQADAAPPTRTIQLKLSKVYNTAIRTSEHSWACAIPVLSETCPPVPITGNVLARASLPPRLPISRLRTSDSTLPSPVLRLSTLY